MRTEYVPLHHSYTVKLGSDRRSGTDGEDSHPIFQVVQRSGGRNAFTDVIVLTVHICEGQDQSPQRRYCEDLRYSYRFHDNYMDVLWV